MRQGGAASELSVPQYDTDSQVEVLYGRSPAYLVQNDMPTFRIYEIAALSNLLQCESGIVATGGGIVSTEGGRLALLGSGVNRVWLRAPFDVCEERVKADLASDRPLFGNIDAARELFNQRQPWYAETATVVIDASRSAKLVVADLVEIARETA